MIMEHIGVSLEYFSGSTELLDQTSCSLWVYLLSIKLFQLKYIMVQHYILCGILQGPSIRGLFLIETHFVALMHGLMLHIMMSNVLFMEQQICNHHWEMSYHMIILEADHLGPIIICHRIDCCISHSGWFTLDFILDCKHEPSYQIWSHWKSTSTYHWLSLVSGWVRIAQSNVINLNLLICDNSKYWIVTIRISSKFIGFVGSIT